MVVTPSGHRHVDFARSHVMLGSINGVERSRVGELQNPNEEQPLAAHFRAFR